MTRQTPDLDPARRRVGGSRCHRGLRWISAAAILLAGIGANVPPAAAQQRVGVSGGVNQDATGTPPRAQPRRLVIGQDIVYNERVTTTTAGQTQVLFVDESSLSVGPDSDITIDRFVYDPNKNAGSLAMSAARGVMRFVGGKLSKRDNAVTLSTNAATIGIRGGVFMANLSRAGRLDVVFVYGVGLTVSGPRGCAVQTITRPGYEVTVSHPGACPSTPYPAPRGQTATMIAQLDGRPGANGGAPRVPTERTVARSGIANTISADFAGSLEQAAASLPYRTRPPQIGVTTLQTQLQVNTARGQGAIDSATQTTTPPPPPVTVTYAGGYASTNSNGTSRGFTQELSYANGALTNGVFTTTVNGVTLTIPLASGSTSFGAAGTASPLGPVSGTSYLSSDGTFFYADLTPVGSPNERELIYGGLPADPAALATAQAAAKFYAFNVQPDAALQSNIPFIPQSLGGSLANASVSPLYVAQAANSAFAPANATGSAYAKALQASLAFSGTGANQSSVLVIAVGNAFTPNVGAGQPLLNGTIEGAYSPGGTGAPVRINSGLLSASDGNGNAIYGSGGNISGFVLNQNNCCNSNGTINQSASATNLGSSAVSNYQFSQPATATGLPAGFSTAQTSQTLTGWFGGTMVTNPTNVHYAVFGSVGVVTDASDLQLAATFGGTDPLTSQASGLSSIQLSFGSLSPGNTAARQAFINDSLFAALESPDTASQVNGVQAVDSNGNPLGASNIYMVNANAVPGATAAILPAGVSTCACQYLQWGYWGGEVDTPGLGRSDIGTINTWIAGIPTVTLPTTGIGTFTGAAIGSVYNNGASYVAAGGFSNTYNFATQSGTLAINNFDGRSFGGTVFGSGTIYGGTLTGSNLTGIASGTFYGPMAPETGGAFAVQATRGAPYLASGIFAGKR